MRTPFEFRVIPDEDARRDWDAWLSVFADRGVRQSRAWAEHKRGSWKPIHTALFRGREPAALALVLERRAPLGLARAAWANAGPVYRRGAPEEDREALAALLRGLTSLQSPRTALRVAPRAPWNEADVEVLAKSGFAPARSPLDSGLTSVLPLQGSLEDLRAGLDRKWRNQLKKAETFSPRFDFGRDRALLERYLRLHTELCLRKGLRAQRLSLPALEKAARDFGPALTFAVGGVDGRDGCGASWWVHAGKATLWLSAADAHGLSKNMPNALYWAIVSRLRAEGVESFDLSGLDPIHNPGVTHFKLGLGGGTLRTLGEWDWARAALTRCAFDLALGAWRGRMP